MKAGDIMTTKVISVDPDMPGRAIARLLFKNGISAVPVVDSQGAPIGMVSEGDLMPRNEAAREARRDWWLEMLSQGEYINPALLKETDRTAREIMFKPVLTVTEDAELSTVADVISRNKIKRVPVVRDGRMVGIVSRADLVKAFSNEGPPVPERREEMPVASKKLEALSARSKKKENATETPAQASGPLSASGLRGLATHFQEQENAKRTQAKHLAEERHQKQVRELLAAHLTEEAWQQMLANARVSAVNGHEDSLLLRFPSELCSDRGRAVNAADHDWPQKLRGMPADIYIRWRNELYPQGFGIHARVVNFEDGVPGDIGLFLSWSTPEAAKKAG